MLKNVSMCLLQIDYTNTLLFLLVFQIIQNCAARLLTKTRTRELITPVLATHHWLPVSFGIDFKVLLLVFKALNGLRPAYVAGSVIL